MSPLQITDPSIDVEGPIMLMEGVSVMMGLAIV
jgi:hypothetical protein